MVNIINRTRRLRERLLNIRVGPGALILPKEVSKITLEFHERIEGGHRGARKFWRTMLPRIKYRNPSIPIEIYRHKTATGPSILNIFKAASASAISSSPASSAETPPSTTPNAHTNLVPETGKPAHSVDIKDMDELEILQHLISRTDAMELKATERELEELKEIEEFKGKSEADRVMVKDKLLKEREEERLLKLARGEIEA